MLSLRMQYAKKHHTDSLRSRCWTWYVDRVLVSGWFKFSVTRKETNPLWQAPPTYFLRRGLSVPGEGSPERSMRGALGGQALFLDQGRAIHSGPIWNDDVGGIKLSSQDMAMLFDAVAVGATVEVR